MTFSISHANSNRIETDNKMFYVNICTSASQSQRYTYIHRLITHKNLQISSFPRLRYKCVKEWSFSAAVSLSCDTYLGAAAPVLPFTCGRQNNQQSPRTIFNVNSQTFHYRTLQPSGGIYESTVIFDGKCYQNHLYLQCTNITEFNCIHT